MLLALLLATTTGCEPETSTNYVPPADPPNLPAQPIPGDTPADQPSATLSGGSSGTPPVAASAPARLVDKTFDDIKFDIEPDAPFDRSMLTDEIESLGGQRIRIRGWMLPTFQRTGIEQFILVRDNQECCFGPGAALYDCIVVDMQPGRYADFSTRSIAVEGTFTIDELIGPGDRHLAIYHLDGEQVE